jgi:hypothetical protein
MGVCKHINEPFSCLTKFSHYYVLKKDSGAMELVFYAFRYFLYLY